MWRKKSCWRRKKEFRASVLEVDADMGKKNEARGNAYIKNLSMCYNIVHVIQIEMIFMSIAWQLIFPYESSPTHTKICATLTQNETHIET
jgi:hypothetical protein